MRILVVLLSLAWSVTGAAGDERYAVHVVDEGARTTWNVELADEPAEHSRGLMFRRSMPAKTGMLFDFGQPEPVSMWMRNTFISLDMVFICADGTVSRVAANTEPESEAIVSSGEDVRYVLEINAGEAARYGIERGDRFLADRDTFFQGDNHDCGR